MPGVPSQHEAGSNKGKERTVGRLAFEWRLYYFIFLILNVHCNFFFNGQHSWTIQTHDYLSISIWKDPHLSQNSKEIIFELTIVSKLYTFLEFAPETENLQYVFTGSA